MTDPQFQTIFAGTPILKFYLACTKAEKEELLGIIGQIHACFDLWYTQGLNPQLRFGYKDIGANATCVVGRLERVRGNRPPLLRLYYGTNGDWVGPIDIAADLPAGCDAILTTRAALPAANGNGQVGLPTVPDRQHRYIFDQVWQIEPEPTQPRTPAQLNTILYGPPGTGKTFATTGLALSIVEGTCTGVASYANALLNGDTPNPPGLQDWSEWVRTYEAVRRDGRIAFTTFHQNYAYEDFVEGIRASVADNQVGYADQDGVLKEIAYRALYEWLTSTNPADVCQKKMADVVRAWLEGAEMPAVEAAPRNYVLIIDEINRGNIARILGELITLLEPTKRATHKPGLGDQPLKVKLPYTRKPFILPPNLYIIGTMNTADRSLIGLDVALRRRFSFVELRPCPELLNDYVDGVNLQTLLETINERIAAELDDEHLLGHAYFMGVDSLAKLADVMRDRVIPQLREYFHDRPDALIRVLAYSGQQEASPLLERNGGRVLVIGGTLDQPARYNAIYA